MEDTRIELNGTEYQISKQLTKYGIFLDEKETKELISAIIKNKKYLERNETAGSRVDFPNFPKGCIGLMTFNYNYHISIKKSSLCVIAYLADKLSYGISGKILAACGVSLKAINKINDCNGEKCIIKETLLLPDKVGNVNVFERFNGNCCNNDMECLYREEERCKCKKENITEIYESLVERGVFRKVNSGYKLNW